MTTPAETRFIELMAELFQLDEADALDFGLYRVIRRHNAEVREFLGEIKADKHGKALLGGRLSALMDEAFTQADEEAKAGDRWRIEELAKSLGLMPGMTPEKKNQRLEAAATFEDTVQKVKEYRRLSEQLAATTTASHDRAEVLNRLHQFFSRHYQDGDFIVERRYGKNGARYIRSTGEDTEFHWATEDMYYIKTGDIFTDFPVRLSNGQRLVFTVEPETLKTTRAQLKPNDKAHYELEVVEKDEAIILDRHSGTDCRNPDAMDGDSAPSMGSGFRQSLPERRDENKFIIRLNYQKGAQSDKHKEAIVEAISAKAGGEPTEIKRWLNRYIARNQSDFFIHKRLKAALTEDLDIFLKTEVLDADQLMGDGDLPKRSIKVARLVKTLGLAIIDFLAALEDFQKALWEKKKLVFETRYVITLDRIERLAGVEWLDSQIALIVGKQREEWQALGLGDYADSTATQRTGQTDLLYEGPRYLPLPVDTGRFDEAFKWDLLEAVTRQTGLDDALDGVAIHSDNWQALNTLQAKYKERVKCIYIDPPYNTDTSGIPYKNGYLHASWNALMYDRLEYLNRLLSNDGAIFVSIDKQERTNLERVLDNIFGSVNHIEELIWTQSTVNSQLPNYATNHEYVEVYSKHRPSVENIPEMFREPKPGFSEIMELIEQISPDYPASIEVEAALKNLIKKRQIVFREELQAIGLEYNNETKKLDPWKGIYDYKFVEYRDSNGKLVPDTTARRKNAKIVVWQSISIAAPASKQAASTRNPQHPNYRFYHPVHEKTGKPCPCPNGGWKFPQFPDSKNEERINFDALKNDNRIHWGKDEKTVPRLKHFLHEVEMNIGKSVFHDYADGERQVSDMFGRSGIFLSPKHTRFVKRFIRQSTKKNDWIVDIFGGSGSSPQAVIESNTEDFGHRRFIVVETNEYFETLIIPRIKKAGTATAWTQGKTKSINGPGLFLRVQTLEQYEDTLENLAFEAEGGQTEISFDDPAFQLRYRLGKTSRKLFTGVERFGSPFGYRLKRVEGGDAPARTVDLVESLVYLLGLDVNRLYREPAGVVLTGSNRRGQSVAVFFRNVEWDDSAAWLQAKLDEHPAEHVYTNDAAALSFQGCERFEAIEAVFALQFGKA